MSAKPVGSRATVVLIAGATALTLLLGAWVLLGPGRSTAPEQPPVPTGPEAEAEATREQLERRVETLAAQVAAAESQLARSETDAVARFRAVAEAAGMTNLTMGPRVRRETPGPDELRFSVSGAVAPSAWPAVLGELGSAELLVQVEQLEVKWGEDSLSLSFEVITFLVDP